MSLQSVLLALLSKEANTGYGVGRLLRHELSHLWEARLQQIYGELARLQAEGLVEAQCIDLPNRPAKKVYSLTSAGEEALDEWLTQRSEPHSCKDDFLVRLYCLERMPTDVAIRRLEERLAEYESEVRELRDRVAQTPRTDPLQLGHLLALEAALIRAEGQATWCAKALSCVREIEQEAPGAEVQSGGRSRRAQLRVARA